MPEIDEKADLIADVLGGALGEDALSAVGGTPQTPEELAQTARDWLTQVVELLKQELGGSPSVKSSPFVESFLYQTKGLEEGKPCTPGHTQERDRCIPVNPTVGPSPVGPASEKLEAGDLVVWNGEPGWKVETVYGPKGNNRIVVSKNGAKEIVHPHDLTKGAGERVPEPKVPASKPSASEKLSNLPRHETVDNAVQNPIPESGIDQDQMDHDLITDPEGTISERPHYKKKIPFSKLTTIQDWIFPDIVKRLLDEKKGNKADFPIVLKMGNEYVLLDGNHRAVTSLLKGESEVTAYVVDGQGRSKNLATYQTKARGQQCKQGENASKTDCIPASDEGSARSSKKPLQIVGDLDSLKFRESDSTWWEAGGEPADGIYASAFEDGSKLTRTFSGGNFVSEQFVQKPKKPKKQKATAEDVQVEPAKDKSADAKIDNLPDIKSAPGLKKTPFPFRELDSEVEEASFFHQDELKVPPIEVPMDLIVSSQRFVDPGNAKEWIVKGSPKVDGVVPSAEYPTVIHIGGKYVLFDGHHRAVAQWALGATKLPVRVVKYRGNGQMVLDGRAHQGASKNPNNLSIPPSPFAKDLTGYFTKARGQQCKQGENASELFEDKPVQSPPHVPPSPFLPR